MSMIMMENLIMMMRRRRMDKKDLGIPKQEDILSEILADCITIGKSPS